MQDLDFAWFVENYDELFSQYGRGYLAIKNQKVLGSYPTVVEALKETTKTEKMGTFIVQECTGSKNDYTVQIASMFM